VLADERSGVAFAFIVRAGLLVLLARFPHQVAIVLGMDTSNVDTVIIAGTVKKRGGRLVGVDVARVTRLAEQSRDFIFSKTGWSRSIFGDR